MSEDQTNEPLLPATDEQAGPRAAVRIRRDAVGINRVYRRGKRWGIDYTDRRTGGRVRQLVAFSRAEAETVLAKVRTSMVEKRYLDIAETPTIRFEAMATEYMGAKAALRSHARLVGSYKAVLPTFKGKLLSEITQREIELWQARRAGELRQGTGRKVRPATVNRELGFLKAMFTKAVEWDKLKVSPAQRVKLLKEHNSRLIYLSVEEEGLLLRACGDAVVNNPGDVHLRPAVQLALNTGVRVGELLALRWADVDRSGGVLQVRDSKNGKSRIIPLSAGACEALDAARRAQLTLAHVLAKSEHVFCHPDGTPFISIDTGFRSALKGAGLANRGFTFHSLRHTFASRLAQRGANLQAIMQLGGWSDIRMVMRYAHLAPGAGRDAMALLDAPGAPEGQKQVSDGTDVAQWTRRETV